MIPTRTRIAAALGLLLAASSAHAEVVDREMAEQSAQIAAAVRTLGAKNVAVLKFQTKIGNRPASWSSGAANDEMARRLENLLILTNDEAKPLTILGDAGLAIAKHNKATRKTTTWATAAGRKDLFAVGKLPLAWDSTKGATPDAYVTGKVTLAADLKTSEVKFYGFTKANPTALKELYTLKGRPTGARGAASTPKVRVDRGMLTSLDIGYSVYKKKPRKGSRSSIDDIDVFGSEDAAENLVKNDPPTGTDESPVSVELLLNGSPVMLEPDSQDPSNVTMKKIAGGQTPLAGQKVTFRLTNRGSENYGVLLAVDGKNTAAFSGDTLDGGKSPDQQRLWVIKPGASYDVAGFYKDVTTGSMNAFDVLDEDTSAEQFEQMCPHGHRGKFQVMVFGKSGALSVTGDTVENREQAQDDTTDADTAQLEAGTVRGLRETGSLAKAKTRVAKATNLTARGASLKVAPASKTKYSKARSAGRGLIIEKQETSGGGKIEVVSLEYDPAPIVSYSVQYYAGRTAPVVPIDGGLQP